MNDILLKDLLAIIPNEQMIKIFAVRCRRRRMRLIYTGKAYCSMFNTDAAYCSYQKVRCVRHISWHNTIDILVEEVA